MGSPFFPMKPWRYLGVFKWDKVCSNLSICTRWDWSYTIVILPYENEYWREIFAHSLMVKFEIWRSHACLFHHIHSETRISSSVQLRFKRNFLVSRDVMESMSYICSRLWNFITASLSDQLVHIQKRKITNEIAVKIALVNGP